MELQHESSLYSTFTREEAHHLISGTGIPRTLCDGEWVVFDNAVLCFTELGDPPRCSYFETAGWFFWVATKSFQVRDDENVPFIPKEVHGGDSDGRPIHLFVQNSETHKFTYLGQLEPSYMQRLGGADNHGEARFALHPAIPSDVWAQFGFGTPQFVSESRLDAQLARLSVTTTLDDRFDILKTLVEYWHGELGPEDGLPEEELQGIAMPAALHCWFRMAGRRKKVMSGQNELVEPARLMKEEGRLIFYGENQWCYEWATFVDGEDPPVFGREDESSAWKSQDLRVSEHLILACLFEATMCHAKYGASTAWLEESKVERLRQQIPAVPLSRWTWCEETRFFAGQGRFMFTMSNGNSDGELGYSVVLGAKTEEPLECVKELVDDDWDYVSL